MSKTPWDDPFEPTGYRLNWEVLWKLPVRGVSSGAEIEPSTVGAVIESLLPDRVSNPDAAQRIQIIFPEGVFRGKTFSTPAATISVEPIGSGTGFAADLLCTVLELSSEGIKNPIFFFYDQDRVTDDLHFLYTFFVADGDRIVRDSVSFSRTPENAFDPSVFEHAFRDEYRNRVSNSAVLRAQVRWWYRKFYEETDAGRQMTLRDDVRLFHFEPQWKVEAESLLELRRIAKELKIMRWLVAGCLMALLGRVLQLF